MNTLAKVPDQKLAELVIRSVYEGDDTRPGGTKVLSIGEVVLGTPAGGWSTTAVIDGPEGEDALSVEYTPEGGYRDWVQGAAGGGDRSAETEQATDSADTFQPPESAANNARRVLAWRDKYGDEVQGMTAVGWARARQLASGNPISLETVKRMSSFNRHRGNYEKARARQKEEGKNPWEYAAITAWLGWGGDSGVSWAISVSGRNDDLPTVDALPNIFTLDSLPQPLRSLAAELAARGPVVYPLDGLVEDMSAELGNRAVVVLDNAEFILSDELEMMADELSSRAVVVLDAEPTDEQLVLLAVRAIYEQSNWKVTGISNLVVGTPEGGLTVDVEMMNPDTRATVKARGTYFDGVFEDELLEETKGDEWVEDDYREDAPAKGKGKGGKGKNCNKGRPCGMSCIAQSKKCRIQTEGVVKESLEKVSSKGKAKPNRAVKGKWGSGGSTQAPYSIPTPEDAAKRMKLIGEGIAGMAYLDSPNNVVVKYRKGARQGETSNLSATFVQREIDIQKLAAGLGVAPKIVGQSDLDFAMEYLKGYKPVMDSKAISRLSTAKQKVVATNIIRQLQKLHQAGIQHNDFHDMNVLFNPRTLDVKVIDYGMAVNQGTGKVNHAVDLMKIDFYISDRFPVMRSESVRNAIKNAANNYSNQAVQKILDEIDKA